MARLPRKVSEYSNFTRCFLQTFKICHYSTTLSPKPFSDIPGPKPLPLVGNIWRYLPLIGEYSIDRLDKNGMYNLKRYGPIVREEIGVNTILHLFDPKDIETLFRHEGKCPHRRSHRALLKYRLDRPELYPSGGLFPENGKKWHRIRTIFQKLLLSEKNVSYYIQPCATITDQLIELVRLKRDSNKEISDFLEIMFRWALENTGVLALDYHMGALNVKECPEISLLIKAAHDTHEAIVHTEMSQMDLWKKYPSKQYRKLVAAQDTMASFVQRHLSARIDAISKKGDQKDGSILMQCITNPSIAKKDLFVMILDMFLAGIDTTALVASFAVYHFARNPDVQLRARREVQKGLPGKHSELAAESLNELSYLKACVKETMRLNPVSIGVGRVLTKDVTIRGFSVPTGVMVITGNQVACRQPDNFTSPMAFRPERWLDETSEAKAKSRFAYIPFGFGPRVCIGKRFSEMEIYVLLAKILRNFHVEYHHEDIGTVTRLINIPDKLMRIRFVDLSD